MLSMLFWSALHLNSVNSLHSTLSTLSHLTFGAGLLYAALLLELLGRKYFGSNRIMGAAVEGFLAVDLDAADSFIRYTFDEQVNIRRAFSIQVAESRQ